MTDPSSAVGTWRAPVVELAGLASPEGVAALDQACRETGFFALVGHGLTEPLDEAFEAAHHFFALDQETKERVPRHNRQGFVPQRDLAIDGDRLAGDTEYLDLGLDADPVWASDALGAELRRTLRDYQERALAVAGEVLTALAVALDVDAGFFAERMRHPTCKLRLLHYLPTPPAADGSAPITNGAHTDYGAITLLATDGVPGLQLQPRGEGWHRVETPDEALVVNLGDLLAFWTNLRYASTPHRVVSSPTAERYSIPFFVNPDPDTVVDCLPSCIDGTNPRRFETVTSGEFLAGRIDGTIPEPFVGRR